MHLLWWRAATMQVFHICWYNCDTITIWYSTVSSINIIRRFDLVEVKRVIMSSKPRPANAAGPNGLRGGIKMYSTKTITGPWLDELGGPAGYKRGFTTVDYQTECQHQQLGATLKQQPLYGAGLPDENVIGRATSPFSYEQTNSGTSSPWLTSSQLMTRSILVRDREKEEATALKPKMDQEKLENYRKTWTTEENDKMRELRFSTETRRAAAHAVKNKFVVPSVRFLPGTPKSLETCRSQLVEKYGIFAFAVIRDALGKKADDGLVGLPEFRLAIHDAGVEMKLYEINQVSFVNCVR